MNVILRPVAGRGHEPTSSMGDDTALPLLAGRARPRLLVLPPALRAGDEPSDRPPARTAHVLPPMHPRRPGPSPDRGARDRLRNGVRELLRLSRLHRRPPQPVGRDLRVGPRGRLPAAGRRGRGVRPLGPGRTARLGYDAGPGADSDAARRRCGPPPAGRKRAALAGDDRGRDRRGARGAPDRMPARLRRRGGLPAPRPGDGRSARGGGQGRRRPAVADGGPGALPRSDRGRGPEDHVQDGHRGRRRVLRCAGVRRARARAGGRRPLLRRHAVAGRRDRVRGARAGGGRPLRFHPARESGLREVPERR